MKLLFFHNTLPEYRIGLFEELNRQCKVTFIITNSDVYHRKYGFTTSRKQDFSCKFLSKGINGFKELKIILESIKDFDAVELPPLDSLREIIMGKLIVNAARENNVKIGYFWEKWEAPVKAQPIKRKIKNKILRIVPKEIYKYADVLQAASKFTKQYFIQNGINKNKIVQVPDVSFAPHCEYIDVRSLYNIPKDKTLLLYLGRIIKQKGLDCLLKALAKVNNTDNNYFLLVAGDGDFKNYCMQLSKKLGLENIVFCGKINPLLRKNYFEQCDVFILPDTYRGGWVDVWGLTVNEAIQFYKPVISTEAVGSADELIKNGVNGFRGRAESTENLVKEILTIKSLKKSKLFSFDQKINDFYNFKNMASLIIKSFDHDK